MSPTYGVLEFAITLSLTVKLPRKMTSKSVYGEVQNFTIKQRKQSLEPALRCRQRWRLERARFSRCARDVKMDSGKTRIEDLERRSPRLKTMENNIENTVSYVHVQFAQTIPCYYL